MSRSRPRSATREGYPLEITCSHRACVLLTVAGMRWLLPLGLLFACAGESGPPIEHGIYGQIVTVSDIGGEGPSPRPGVPITAYVDGTEVAQTVSNPDGEFQLELTPATYVVCVNGADPATLADQRMNNCAGDCTRIDVADVPIEANWGWNLSGGLWDAGDYCP